MTIRPGIREALWMAIGAAVLAAAGAVVFHFQDERSPEERLAEKARHVRSVDRMLAALAAASAAEKSAVLAGSDEESRVYADEARSATANAEKERQTLAERLDEDGTPDERDALAQFSEQFAELRRIDDELLPLAVRNSNVKATALAFGPAADAVREMSSALDRVAGKDTGMPALLARNAEIGVLRIQALIPPHIAEEDDAKMDEIESRMTAEEVSVRADLASLAALPDLAGNADLSTATARYARFGELRKEILELSRTNTNVRSLSISLNQKAKAMRLCRDALLGLRQTIEAAPPPGEARGPVPKPR